MSPKVYIKLPKAGLGNMLLTWSRAYVFAQLNELEMHTSPWTKLHWGALLRREKKSRLYLGYFKRGGLLKTIRFAIYLKTKKIEIEPAVEKLNPQQLNTVFVFNKIFTDYDFFKEVRPYKEMVRNGLIGMLSASIKVAFDSSPKPVIGLHIRRGDFKRGSTLTPLSFYVDVVKKLRADAGEKLPVTVFTDAEPGEVEEVLALGHVNIANSQADIIDILLLASSQFVVLAIGSTFSYWAAFLSENVIIKHPQEWHAPFGQPADENFSKELVWR